MKIGILTIYGGTGNYGNILQNYGLQYFLKQHNVDVETIRYEISTSSAALHRGAIDKIYSKIFSAGSQEVVNRLLRFLKKFVYRKRLQQLEQKRQESFYRFEREYIVTSKKKYSKVEELFRLDSEYNYFIVGSDQVWNPYGHGAFDEYFLNFTEKSKRIAYAPSIGLSTLNFEQKERYRFLLNGFEFLSCRESTGKKIVEELSGKYCEHVVDPVLLVGEECWNTFIRENTQGKYILTYFLGEPSRKTLKYVNDLGKKYNTRIIDIYDSKSTLSQFASVEEFINLIAHAEMFITDSFHGCAFSIMLETVFLVSDRHFASKAEKMNSRIDDMLERLGIGSRYISNVDLNKKIDFCLAKQRLGEWKTKSGNFLLQQIERVSK